MSLDRVLEPEAMDDPAEAAAYSAMDHSVSNAAFVDRLLQLNASGRMLDLGTGPGDIPLLIADRLAPTPAYLNLFITAVDLAPAMLEIARQRIVGSPHGDHIELVEADVKALPFADGAFDAVFSNTILHHIPEPIGMLAEARRMLRPGGALLIRDLFRPPDEATLDRLVETHAALDTPDQRRMFADSLRAALTPDELRGLVDKLAWRNATVTVDTDRHVSVQITAS